VLIDPSASVLQVKANPVDSDYMLPPIARLDRDHVDRLGHGHGDSVAHLYINVDATAVPPGVDLPSESAGRHNRSVGRDDRSRTHTRNRRESGGWISDRLTSAFRATKRQTGDRRSSSLDGMEIVIVTGQGPRVQRLLDEMEGATTGITLREDRSSGGRIEREYLVAADSNDEARSVIEEFLDDDATGVTIE
jgi:hypothetical protein